MGTSTGRATTAAITAGRSKLQPCARIRKQLVIIRLSAWLSERDRSRIEAGVTHSSTGNEPAHFDGEVGRLNQSASTNYAKEHDRRNIVREEGYSPVQYSTVL